MGVTNHLLNGMILKKSDALKKVVTPKTPDLESQGHFSGKKKKHTKNSWKNWNDFPNFQSNPVISLLSSRSFFGEKKTWEISTGALWKPSTSSRRWRNLENLSSMLMYFLRFWLKGERATLKDQKFAYRSKSKQKKTMSMDDSFRKKRRKKESSCYCALGGIMLKFKPHPFGGTVHPPELWCGWHKRSQNESPSRCTNTGLKGGTKSFSTHMSLDFPRPDRDLPSF